MRIVTLEEHFVSKHFMKTVGVNLGGMTALDLSREEVTDLGALRLKHMDESGIDMQVLSHTWPTWDAVPSTSRLTSRRTPMTSRQRPSPPIPIVSPPSLRYP